MKKFYGILFFFTLICFKTNLEAQSLSDAIKINVFAQDPPTRGHNYFGVKARISVAEISSQNIIITGYIHSDQTDDQNHPFTLTISAGDDSAVTSSTFYDCPTIGAAITLANISPTPFVSPENINNPYDQIGKDHNDGLDYIIQNYPTITSTYFQANWKDIVSGFLASKNYSVDSFLNVINNSNAISQVGNLTFYQSTTPEQEATGFLNNGLLNQTKYDNITSIYNLIHEADSLYDNSANINYVYANFKAEMLNLENSFSNLNDTDKNILYMVASTARYSAYYWFNQTSLSSSPWHVPNNNALFLKKPYESLCSSTNTTKFFKVTGFWGNVGKADAGGAVGGAVRFGVAALFGGPVGWGACGAAALGTGLGASAGVAILSLF